MVNFLHTNIKYLRKQKKLSQEDLAKVFSKKSSAVGGWETEYSYPDFITIHKIAEYFEISVGDLIEKDLENSESVAKNEINGSNHNLINQSEKFKKTYQAQGGQNIGSESVNSNEVELLRQQVEFLKSQLKFTQDLLEKSMSK